MVATSSSSCSENSHEQNNLQEALLEPSWAEPIFVHFHEDLNNKNSQENSINDHQNVAGKSTTSSDLWVKASDKIADVKVFAYLLLNGFGENSETIVKYVANNLLPYLLKSEAMVKIAGMVKRPKSAKASMDEQMKKHVKDVFLRVDNEFYEEALKPLLQEEVCDGAEAMLDLSSGCSALLALILDEKLYVANCGNSVAIFGKEIDGQMAIFQLSESHVTVTPQDTVTISISPFDFLSQLPTRFFGDYLRKQDNYGTVSAEPSVIHHIDLNHTAHFLLIISPTTSKLLQKMHSEDDANNVICSLVIDALNDESRSPIENLQEILERLGGEFLEKIPPGNSSNPPESLDLSFALIDLSNSIDDSTLGSSSEQGSLGSAFSTMGTDTADNERAGRYGQTTVATVKSEVDWSEFYTHHLRDEVLAKIESLKQHYKERNELVNIEEDYDEK